MQVRVLEFEVSYRWRSKSVSRSLRETLTRVHMLGYDCYWQGSAGCLAPASGVCWRQLFDVCPGMLTAKDFCQAGTPMGMRSDGRPANMVCGLRGTPLAESLWSLADRCKDKT